MNFFWTEFQNKGAQVLMLQHNPIQTKSTHAKGIVRVIKSLCTAGYIVCSSYIPTLLINLNHSLKMQIPCDVGYCELQKRGGWYALQPAAGKQRPSFSNIENKYVNYRI